MIVRDTREVGLYPNGASPYGCLDMAGNVWEWCNTASHRYPYRVDDGREELDVFSKRIVRGGSFCSYNSDVRCASRFESGEAGRFGYQYDLGFRVVFRGLLLT